jgi:lysophospholipase L1-like esterase
LRRDREDHQSHRRRLSLAVSSSAQSAAVEPATRGKRELTRRRALLTLSSIIAAPETAEAESKAMHLVLLGDSVFDNGAYVHGSPDVRAQVAAQLQGPSVVTLLARDGAVIADVHQQLSAVPSGATHVVISAGGNDALRASSLLDAPVSSVSGALSTLNVFASRFAHEYHALLDKAVRAKLPVAVCSIYEPRYPLPYRGIASTALTLLNDVITRAAFTRRLTLIDLRVIFDTDDDFANPIEPSSKGGAKIANAIAQFTDGSQSSAVIANADSSRRREQ